MKEGNDRLQKVKRRGSRLRRDVSKGNASLRSDESGTTGTKDGKKSKNVVKARSSSSYLHRKTEPNSAYQGSVSDDEDVA